VASGEFISVTAFVNWFRETYGIPLPPDLPISERYRALSDIISSYASANDLELTVDRDGVRVPNHIAYGRDIQRAWGSISGIYRHDLQFLQPIKESLPGYLREKVERDFDTVSRVADFLVNYSESQLRPHLKEELAKMEKYNAARPNPPVLTSSVGLSGGNTTWVSGNMSRPTAPPLGRGPAKFDSPLLPTNGVYPDSWKIYPSGAGGRSLYNEDWARFIARGEKASPRNQFPLYPGTLPCNAMDCNRCGREWKGREHRCISPAVPPEEQALRIMARGRKAFLMGDGTSIAIAEAPSVSRCVPCYSSEGEMEAMSVLLMTSLDDDDAGERTVFLLNGETGS